MSSVGVVATDLLAWHRRMGSQLPEWINVGSTVDEVVGSLALVGLEATGEARQLVELYATYDGVDQEGWARTQMPWPAELWPRAVFYRLDEALRLYAANRAMAVEVANSAPGGDPSAFWPEWLLPVFGYGGDAFAVDCCGPCPGSIWLWYLEPTTADPCRCIARTLTALLETVRLRFATGIYRWDAEHKMVTEDAERPMESLWPALGS